MQLPEPQGVSNPNLLQILIDINLWEVHQGRELQTISGRDLYFLIAATLLTDADGKSQSLKLLNGRMTDRATRNRIREFQALGLVEVIDNEDDARTKRVVPTEKFIRRLNHHLYMFQQICQNRFLMLDK